MRKRLNIFLLCTIGLVGIILTRPLISSPAGTQPSNSPYPNVPSPTPFIFTTYQPPVIQSSPDYAIFTIGDSMTKALGPHLPLVSTRINAAYPEKDFVLDNYSEGSLSILALPEKLLQPMQWDNLKEDAILKRDPDILIIESFAHNPLSNLPLEEGLRKQEEILSQVMTTLVQEKPHTYIIFLATIGPNKVHYAQGIAKLSPQERQGWARERIAYLENFIRYAHTHTIPLINVYEKTSTSTEGGELRYINPDDYIHPSSEGVDFMSDEIVNFIITQKILPH